jgi:hypothetical protein
LKRGERDRFFLDYLLKLIRVRKHHHLRRCIAVGGAGALRVNHGSDSIRDGITAGSKGWVPSRKRPAIGSP